ncbi:DNA polymerase [Novipirellula artificiosorum]|nr:DNA polymerase [Novipirellula artificiosorum]
MRTQQLFDTLSSLGLQVKLNTAGAPEVVGDIRKLTDPVKQALREHRQLFIDVLSDVLSDGPTALRNVRLGNETYSFGNWGLSERLLSPIAIDTETELIEGRKIPKIALASVSDGTIHRLIDPADLQAFIDAHSDCHYVCHNAAFDFVVIRKALSDPANWVQACDDGRLHDTMLLDSLVRLARSDEFPTNRDLGTLAQSYLKIAIDKDDPYRLRYGELIGQPWDNAEPGFFTYAIKDAIVTWSLYKVLSAIAEKLAVPFASQMLPDCRSRYGLLTESLQVRGAIALAHIERTGLSIDQGQVERTKKTLDAEVERVIHQIQTLPGTDGFFKVDSCGDLSWTAAGKPSINRSKLIEILSGIASDHGIDVPRTEKTDDVSTSVKFWSQHVALSVFLSLWVRLEETTKLRQFLTGLNSDRIHPRYMPLVRTGRTSCSRPNIQQLPRSGGFREMIVPTQGHYFLTIDYSAIELRTLAAICQRRYGASRLGDVIRKGDDPHAFTAAMFEGVALDAFEELPNKKELRQRSKALNFGIPGGLGAKSLVAYAESTYGVSMTIEEAQQFRQKLVVDVYPELSKYLDDDLPQTLAWNLKATPFGVRSQFDTDGRLGAAKRIVAGKGRANGESYGDAFIDQTWASLKDLNQNAKLRDRIANRDAGEQLSRDLFNGPVCTPTGRIRGAVGFSQARNTPFQGLAADGAKLALWRLCLAGYRCVAFIHDEVVIELPIESDHTEHARTIDRILCESMEELTGDIPVACQYALTDRWHKDAEAVYDTQGRLLVWRPKS